MIGLILLGGLIGVFIISYILDALIERASGPLPIDTRNTIYQAEAATLLVWRIPDALGIALMLLGILKSRGMLGGIGGVANWGIPAMAIGLLLVCGANTARAWMRKRTYERFAPGSAATRTVAMAAIVMTIAELALAGVTLFYTGDKILALGGGKTKGGTTAATGTGGGTTPTVSTRPNDGQWIDEEEALDRLKGRGPAYLKALVEKSHVRTEVQDGQTMYKKNDFDSMLEFPAYEELGLKKP